MRQSFQTEVSKVNITFNFVPNEHPFAGSGVELETAGRTKIELHYKDVVEVYNLFGTYLNEVARQVKAMDNDKVNAEIERRKKAKQEEKKEEKGKKK